MFSDDLERVENAREHWYAEPEQCSHLVYDEEIGFWFCELPGEERVGCNEDCPFAEPD